MSERKQNRIDATTLDREELAGLFRVSSRTISRLRAKGVIPPPVRIGGLVRWRAKDVVRFLESLPAK